MTEALNIPINIEINQQIGQVAALLDALAGSGDKARSVLAGLTTTSKELYSEQSNTLGLYNQLIKLTNDFSSANTKVIDTSTQMEAVTKSLGSAFETLGGALSTVEGTEKEQYDAQSNTIKLYQQTLQLSQQSATLARTEAQTVLALAQAEKQLADAKLATAKASDQEIVSARTAAGIGAPQTGNNAADNAAKQAQLDRAAAIRATQEAQKSQAQEEAAAQAAAARTAAADKAAAQAENDRTAATEKEIAALKASITANTESSTATKTAATATDTATHAAGSNQFALYQVAYAYKALSTAAIDFGIAPVAAAESFQTAFAQVQRTLETTVGAGQTFTAVADNLRNTLVSLSETIPVSFENLSKIATIGNQLGIASADVGTFTETVAKFSAVTNVSAESAATSFGRLSALLGVTADQYNNVANTVAYLGLKSAATETEIINVATNIAGAASTAHYTQQDVLGLSDALASLKVPPELARGTMTRVLGAITTAANEGGPKLEAYAKVLGITSDAAASLAKQSPAAFFQQLIEGLSKTVSAGGDLNKELADIGIKNNHDVAVVQRLSGNYQLLADSVRNSYLAYSQAGTGQDELNRQTAFIFYTLSAQIQKTKDAASAFFDSVGQGTLGPLNGLATIIESIFTNLTKLSNTFKDPVFTLALIIGGIAAYRGALALAIAAISAFRQAVGSATDGAGVSFRGLLNTIRETSTGASEASAASSASIVADNNAIAASVTPVVLAQQEKQAAQAAQVAADRATLASLEAVLALQAEQSAQTAASAQIMLTANSLAAAGLDNLSKSVLENSSLLTLNTDAVKLNVVADGYQQAANELALNGFLGLNREVAAETAGLLVNTAEIYRNAAARAEQATLTGEAAAADAANSLATEENSAATAANTLAKGENAVANEAAGAAKGIGGLAGFLGGPWGIALVGATVLLSAFAGHLTDASKAAADAVAQQQKLESQFVSLAGGSTALSDAIAKDTAAYTEAGNQATAQNGVYATYQTHIEDLHNGQAKVTQGWSDQSQAAIDASAKIYSYADSMQVVNGKVTNLSASEDAFGNKIGLTTDQINQQTIALGNNYKQLEIIANNKAIFGDGTTANPGAFTAADRQQFAQAGVDLGQAVNNSIDTVLVNGKEIRTKNFQQEFAGYLADAQKQAAAIQAKINAVRDAETNTGRAGGLVGAASGSLAPVTQADRDKLDNLNRQIAAINSLNDLLNAQRGASENAAAGQATLTAADKLAGISAIDLNTTLADTQQTLADQQKAQDKVGKSLSELASDFSAVTTDAFSFSDAVGTVSKAYADLGTSIGKNGTDFSNLTDGGRANLAALQATVTAESNVLKGQIQAGSITAEQAAVNLQTYIKNLVKTLASEGVDTHQIDFLVKYVDSVVKTPAVWGISADTSTATNAITNLIEYAGQAKNYIAGSANSSEHDQSTTVPVPVATSTLVPTDVTAGVSAVNLDLQKNIEIVAAQYALAQTAATAAGAAERSAGQAANTAAKDAAAGQRQANAAATLANDTLKQQQSLLVAIGDYYAKFGTQSFAAADSTGAVIKSLQDLGTALANNGTSFSNYSAGGQANIKALETSLNSYGESLKTGITAGTISVGAAKTNMEDYVAGLRQALSAAGVPTATLAHLFDNLGVSAKAFGTLTGDTAQYAGVLQQADKAAAAALNVGRINAASDATKQLIQYTKDLGSFYGSLGSNIFSAVDAEGKVYEALQKVGAALQANGTGFNTTTQGGRDNFSTLEATLTSYGDLLNKSLAAGTISASQAALQYKEFAQGVYSELIKLGVSASSVTAIFSGLGINTSGWKNATQAVSQYAGVLTDAEKAAEAVAVAQGKANVAAQQAATYAANLTTAFDKIIASTFSLQNASDATASAILGIKDSYQAALDKVNQLRQANAGLANDIASAQVNLNKDNANYILAVKYGQTAEAASFLAQANTAQTTITNDKSTLATNNVTISKTNAGIGDLKDNTAEAIANRKALGDLQDTMLKQIEAYAATGKTTAQVTAYTKELQKQFDDTARQAGFSQQSIKTYDDVFKSLSTTIQTVPRTVSITATANTSPATAALNALPTSGRYDTVATTDTLTVRQALAAIPTQGNYVSNAQIASVPYVEAQIASIPTHGTYTVSPTISSAGSGVPGLLTRNGLNGGQYVVQPVLSQTGRIALVNSVRDAMTNTRVQVGSAVTGLLNALGLNIQGNIATNTMTADGLNINKGISTPTISTSGVIRSGAGTILFNQGGLTGMYSGGLVPGTPPANPNADNLLAEGPSGFLGIRSREYVQPQPAVDKYGVQFMDSIRNLSYKPVPQFTAATNPQVFGSVGYTGSGGSGSGAVSSAMLSPNDRRLMAALANRPVVAVIAGSSLSTSQAHQASADLRSGRN